MTNPNPPPFDRYDPIWAYGTTWTDFEAHVRPRGEKCASVERADIFANAINVTDSKKKPADG